MITKFAQTKESQFHSQLMGVFFDICAGGIGLLCGFLLGESALLIMRYKLSQPPQVQASASTTMTTAQTR